MPIATDFELARYSDGVLTMELAPAAAIGGWSLRFQLFKRRGGSTALATRYAASGYGGGASGITVNQSGTGVISLPLYGNTDLSGQDPGNYYYQIDRTDSGSVTELANGYILYN